MTPSRRKPAKRVKVEDYLNDLRSTITKKVPYCAGTIPVSKEDLVLYYGTNKIAHRIDFGDASIEELKELCDSCEPATFGLNKNDVLDESYRKAGKMDTSAFSSKFNLGGTELLNILRSDLLEGLDDSKPIRTELYKLNVYGPGSFFKTHKDTPRGELMFGSLVVIFPTVHEGGSLLLSDGNDKWTFDSGRELSEKKDPCVAYAAFFSDVEHEVTPVKSGYRVTLTYNLYFTEDKVVPRPPSESLAVGASAFRDKLSELIADPAFAPNGMVLGFGLRHQYPLNVESGLIEHLPDCVKGTDAIIYRVCKNLGLDVSFRIVVDTDDSRVLMNRWTKEEFISGDCELTTNLKEYYGGKVIEISDEYDSDDDIEPDFVVHWVTDLTEFTRHRFFYTAYGNEATANCEYAVVCLIVLIPPANKRRSVGKESKAVAEPSTKNAQ